MLNFFPYLHKKDRKIHSVNPKKHQNADLLYAKQLQSSLQNEIESQVEDK